MDKKLKGTSPYIDKADNYNIDIDNILAEAQIPTSEKTRFINYVILSFVKMYDFAQSRSEDDYKEAKRLLGVVYDIWNK